MVYESIDHGNDVACHAVQVVLFLVFRKKINVIVKNKSTTIFHGVHSYSPFFFNHVTVIVFVQSLIQLDTA